VVKTTIFLGVSRVKVLGNLHYDWLLDVDEDRMQRSFQQPSKRMVS